MSKKEEIICSHCGVEILEDYGNVHDEDGNRYHFICYENFINTLGINIFDMGNDEENRTIDEIVGDLYNEVGLEYEEH